MVIDFQLQQRLAGFTVSPALKDDVVQIVSQELVGPLEASHLQGQLEKLQGVLFSQIPGAPPPSLTDHILVVIRPDLTATAYINELANIRAEFKPKRDITAGELITLADIETITSIDLGVEIPNDCGVVLVRSQGWKRSLFFDLGPLQGPQRTYPIGEALAKQALLLLGLPITSVEGEGQTTLAEMSRGLDELHSLFAKECQEEARYQELLEAHPWMLGGNYVRVRRHLALDDRSIPDFTATRSFDGCDDLIELKQPFLPLFRKNGSLSSNFNDAWNQAEQYLAFAKHHRSYLEEKEIRIENPRCVLVAGHKLSRKQRRIISEKEAMSTSVTVFTYDELRNTAGHLLELVKRAGDRTQF